MSSFLGLWVSFFWFSQKNSQVCWNSNLSVQRKNFKKLTFEQMVFRLFRTLTRKTCIFAGKIFTMLSKLLSTYPEEHLQSNISEGKSLNLEDFWINFENSGTTAENLFQGWQNSNGCPGNSLGKKLFKRENFAILPDSKPFSYF